MEILTLPPELERFAAETVAAGRYRDFSDVVAAGIGMLRRTEDARAKLLQSVQAAERKGELNGFLTIRSTATPAFSTEAKFKRCDEGTETRPAR
jgi:putative addiction module CopG family antidote